MALSDPSPALAESKVKTCGVIAPMSGPAAWWGDMTKGGIELAQRELDPEEKILRFVIEDDQFLAKNALSALHKLITSDNIECLIIFGTASSLAVAKLVEEKGIPTISVSLIDTVTDNRKYIYRLFSTIPAIGDALAAEVNRRNYLRVAAITTEHEGVMSVLKEFKTSYGKQLVFDELLPAGETDIKVAAIKLKQSKADAVFVNTLAPHSALITRQLRSMGFKGEFFSGPPITNPSEVAASKGALEGTWFVSLNNKTEDGFIDKFIEAYKVEPTPEAMIPYAAAKLFIEGIKSGGVHKYITSQTAFETTVGTCTRKDQVFDCGLALWEVKDGRFVRALMK